MDAPVLDSGWCLEQAGSNKRAIAETSWDGVQLKCSRRPPPALNPPRVYVGDVYDVGHVADRDAGVTSGLDEVTWEAEAHGEVKLQRHAGHSEQERMVVTVATSALEAPPCDHPGQALSTAQQANVDGTPVQVFGETFSCAASETLEWSPAARVPPLFEQRSEEKEETWPVEQNPAAKDSPASAWTGSGGPSFASMLASTNTFAAMLRTGLAPQANQRPISIEPAGSSTFSGRIHAHHHAQDQQSLQVPEQEHVICEVHSHENADANLEPHAESEQLHDVRLDGHLDVHDVGHMEVRHHCLGGDVQETFETHSVAPPVRSEEPREDQEAGGNSGYVAQDYLGYIPLPPKDCPAPPKDAPCPAILGHVEPLHATGHEEEGHAEQDADGSAHPCETMYMRCHVLVDVVEANSEPFRTEEDSGPCTDEEYNPGEIGGGPPCMVECVNV